MSFISGDHLLEIFLNDKVEDKYASIVLFFTSSTKDINVKVLKVVTGPLYTNEHTKIQDVAVVPETENVVYSGYVSHTVEPIHGEKYRKDMNIAGTCFFAAQR